MTDAMREDPPDWFDGDRLVHVCNNAYFIDGEQTLLYDTVSPGARNQLMDALEELLNGNSLDYVVPSHPEAPHAGNANALLQRYPDATLLSSAYGRGEELYYLDQGRQVEAGETLDLGGYTVEFLDATFPDTAFHIWLKEHTSNTLFTADWMGSPHLEGECLLFSDELDSPLSAKQIMEFQARALRWLQYCDPELVHRSIDDLIQTHNPDIVCPAHGTVIREDAVAYMEEMKRVVDMITTGERLAELK
ncbi:MBL fold metallo-hydrolase (plasmid) [Natrinema zhouii]|uniref:MBL fold metallo-hydrolase n=1 Tax=Natrinema zhouii TaxID=1710539 RepID=UPI001CFF71F0|nr:MBL fold metallo-hydrolase [Natrinema zhouii]UHQ98227.1 MBL fold metallo-hydrolase [Natrinema zhouii]